MSPLPRHLSVIAAVVAASLGACLDSQEPSPGPTKQAPDPGGLGPRGPQPQLTITATGGNNQETALGTEVARALEVRVTRGGAAVEGAAVAWQLTSGAGTFRPSSLTQTDADGRALVFFTPTTQGAFIRASVFSGSAAQQFRVLPLPFSVYEGAGQRLVFYPDSTIALVGNFVNTGRFARSDSVLSLSFAWGGGAVATVRQGSLRLDYDVNLEVDGFADGELFLVPTAGTSPGWFENPGALVPVLDQSIVQLFGRGQEGDAGVELAEPFIARLRSPSGAVAGIPVRWQVESGGGSFRPNAASVTNAAGESVVYFTPAGSDAVIAVSLPGTSQPSWRFRVFPHPVAAFGSVTDGLRFYPNQTFAFRIGGGPGVWEGTFQRVDDLITLDFGANSVAVGTLRGDSLLVDFNSWMEGSDFEDDTLLIDHARTPGTSW